MELIKERELENINKTGQKCLFILKKLLERPLTDFEINEILNFKFSKDTISLYINTLRAIGCVIARPAIKTNYKYKLESHPFKIELSEQDLKQLIYIRLCLAQTTNWRFLVDIDSFFLEIIHLFQTNKAEDTMNKISNLERLLVVNSKDEAKKVFTLDNYCRGNYKITISYNSIKTGFKFYELIPKYISCENNTLYLWSINLENNQNQYFRLDRIIDIVSEEELSEEVEAENIKAKYRLTGTSAILFKPDYFQKISVIDEQTIEVEEKVYSNFHFFQKVLTFGAECTILEPLELRKEFIEVLKNIKGVYK